jgi:ribosomal protein L19
MGKDGKSYTFRTLVRSLAGGVFSLVVHVEEGGKGRAQEFEGVILDGGRSGNMVQVGREGRTSVFSWNAR